MFFSINSKTGEKVNSLTVESDSAYQFIDEEIWYADPDEIESCPDDINKEEIVVSFRKGKERVINYNGTEYPVSPHFFIPNKEKLGINTIPESREHKLAKNWIYSRLYNKRDFKINYSEVSKPFKYFNSINLLELPIDKTKVGLEITASTFGNKIRRRADIICPFYVKHPLFGNGIVFEIQFSNQRQKTKVDRELDWALRGFSVCWLYQDDFNYITDSNCDLKKDYVLVDSWACLLKKSNKEHIKNLKFNVQEEVRKLKLKQNELIEDINKNISKLNEDFQRNCQTILMKINEKEESIGQDLISKLEVKYETILNRKTNSMISELRSYAELHFQPKCGVCGSPAKVSKNFSNGEQFWSCPNYPNCKGWTMPYKE